MAGMSKEGKENNVPMVEMNDESQEKTVLCILQYRIRPVTFVTDKEPQKERNNLLEAVKMSFSDLLSCGEGTNTSPASYFLQCESSEWGMIELRRSVQDRKTIHLCLLTGESDVSEACVLCYSRGAN